MINLRRLQYKTLTEHFLYSLRVCFWTIFWSETSFRFTYASEVFLFIHSLCLSPDCHQLNKHPPIQTSVISHELLVENWTHCVRRILKYTSSYCKTHFQTQLIRIMTIAAKRRPFGERLHIILSSVTIASKIFFRIRFHRAIHTSEIGTQSVRWYIVQTKELNSSEIQLSTNRQNSPCVNKCLLRIRTEIIKKQKTLSSNLDWGSSVFSPTKTVSPHD